MKRTFEKTAALLLALTLLLAMTACRQEETTEPSAPDSQEEPVPETPSGEEPSAEEEAPETGGEIPAGEEPSSDGSDGGEPSGQEQPSSSEPGGMPQEGAPTQGSGQSTGSASLRDEIYMALPADGTLTGITVTHTGADGSVLSEATYSQDDTYEGQPVIEMILYRMEDFVLLPGGSRLENNASESITLAIHSEGADVILTLNPQATLTRNGQTSQVSALSLEDRGLTYYTQGQDFFGFLTTLGGEQ